MALTALRRAPIRRRSHARALRDGVRERVPQGNLRALPKNRMWTQIPPAQGVLPIYRWRPLSPHGTLSPPYQGPLDALVFGRLRYRSLPRVARRLIGGVRT